MEDSEGFEQKALSPINKFEPFSPTSTGYTSLNNDKRRKQRIAEKAGQILAPISSVDSGRRLENRGKSNSSGRPQTKSALNLTSLHPLKARNSKMQVLASSTHGFK